PLADGRFGVTLSDAQGQTLLNAQLTVQRLPAGSAGVPGTASLPAALPATLATAVPTASTSPAMSVNPAIASPMTTSVAQPAVSTLPAATAPVAAGSTDTLIKLVPPTAATGPVQQPNLLNRTAQSVPAGAGISLPELSRSSAVPNQTSVVNAAAVVDSAVQSAS